MNTQTSIPNAYTDAPDLHPNLLIASFQVLFWIYFHPSAWRNYIARIDPELRPDFWLVDLETKHWRNPLLHQLLLAVYVVWPLFVGLLSVWDAWLNHTSLVIQFGTAFGMALGMAFGAGIAGIMMAFGMVWGIVYDGISNIASVLAIGVAAGLGGHTIVSISRPISRFSLIKQIGGVTLGIIGGAVVLVSFTVVVRIMSGFTSASTTFGLAFALVYSMTFGVIYILRTHNWRRRISFPMILGVIVVLVFSMIIEVSFDASGGATVILVGGMWGSSVFGSSVFGMLYGGITAALFVLSYIIGERMGGIGAGAIAATMNSGGVWIAISALSEPVSAFPNIIWGVLAMLAGFMFSLWRPMLFYPVMATWNTQLLRREEPRVTGQPALLRWHAAFWDEYQRLPWFGLDDHVVLVYERNALEGQAALDYLSTSCQRWAAQAAQTELDARQLERKIDVDAIRHVHHTLSIGELVGPVSAILHSFRRMSQDVDAALQQESNYNQRLSLNAVEDRLDAFLRELIRSNERYAIRFLPIATSWRQAVTDHIQSLVTSIEERQEIDSPYVLGVPLTIQQEIFVGRVDICARIEQLLLDRRRPPLLLYGQRRMGKTSLLNNLGRLLPSTIIPLFVDLQGPATRAEGYTGLLYNVARGMVESAQRQRVFALPILLRESLNTDPFTVFDEWLDQVEHALGDHTALLMLDEFEALESAMQRGRYDEEDIFGLLRHLIQHRPRFKVLLAGSHTLAEYQRWASYLINIQTVPISYLKEEEARQLIERPVKEFTLRYEASASQRIIDLTRCHPFLVQLLCSELVALKNEQDPSARRLATLADVEAAVPEALAHGSMFFADLEHNQVNEAGRTVLRQLAACGEGGIADRAQLAQSCPDSIDETLKLLQQRELIEPIEGGYRFQVELIRRWFMQQS